MINRISKIFFIIFTLSIFSITNAQNRDQLIPVDSLAIKIGQYVGKQVTIEGKIIHVCPVGGLKMKLKSESGIIVKISAGNTYKKFEKSYNGKFLRIMGTAGEERTEETFIAQTEKSKQILCHIDNSYCKDDDWIAQRVKEGRADSISIKHTMRLRQKMLETKTGYISVPTITAEQIVEIK